MNFKEWMQLNEGWKDWAASAALTGSLLATGCDKTGCKPSIQSQSTTSPAAAKFLNSDDKGPLKGWNSKLGDFQAIPDGRGGFIYRTEKGDFKIHKSKFGPQADRYIKI